MSQSRKLMCKGCGAAVAKPVTCTSCDVASHPGCVHRTQHPFHNGKLLDCGDDMTPTASPTTQTAGIEISPNDVLLKKIKELLDARFSKLENELDAKFSKLENELRVFQSNLELLNNSLTDLDNRVSKLESNCSEEDMLEELADRNRRSTNIIMFNLGDTDATTDICAVNSLLRETDVTETIGNFSVKRLGRKNSSKPRPLCVSFNSPSIPIKILKNKHRYSGPARISNDSTVKQRAFLNNLRVKLRDMNDQNKTIRYVNGTPRIVTINRQLSKN